MLLPCLSWLRLFTRLFASFCSPSPTLVFRLVCLPTLASSKHCQKVQREGERERENERQRERARSRSQDALWVSLLNEARSTVHGAPSAEHTSKPVLHLYCQHLEEERRGARVEQPLSGAGSLPTASLVDVPFKLPTRATKLLMCLPHYRTFFYFHPIPGFFYFANVPLSPRLLCLFFCFFLL